MLVYEDLLTGDELLSDSFNYKELYNGALWEVEGKWVVQGAIDVNIGANPSEEGGDDEGVDDQAVKVVDIVDTFRLQEQPAFEKKQFMTCWGPSHRCIDGRALWSRGESHGWRDQTSGFPNMTFMKRYIKLLAATLEGDKLEDFKTNVEAATKFLFMHDDGSLVFAYYKDGASDPTFLYFAHGLKEIKH
ncbi:hypothetical protein ACHQM5_009488 [Ranunculus cassubicifolius]